MNDKKEIIESLSYNQHDILRGITKLHLAGERIELDPCYGRGQFYKPHDIQEPSLAYDSNLDVIKDVTHRTVYHYNAISLPHLDQNSISSIIFDPPFLRTTGKGSIIKDRFGSYPTMEELWSFYSKALWEFGRILMSDGKLIVKIQNTIMSGKQWRSERFISNLVGDYGFEFVDEFILGSKVRMKQWNLKNQRHARKHHCFFLVFKKVEV